MDGYPGTVAAQTWPSKLPVAWHNSTWVGDRTVEFIKANRDRPWCLWASIPDPHHPFDAPEPWCRLHHPDEVDLPRHRVRDFERRPWWHRAAMENEPSAGKYSELRKAYSRIAPQSDAQLRALIANYFGMISLIDHTLGRILIALAETGQAENTYVVFTSDHGDWLGDHGLILKGPMHYEGLLRVGLIVRGPGVPAGKVVGDPVSTLCLAATFLDWSGTSPLRAPQGHTLAPVIVGREGRDYAYNEWELLPSRAGVALSLRTVRTRTHKLTVDEKSGAGELYDLAGDPDEMDNRFADPGMAVVQRELVDMIRARPAERIDGVREQVGTA
jgi:arylsulfatase A-like enzyme